MVESRKSLFVEPEGIRRLRMGFIYSLATNMLFLIMTLIGVFALAIVPAVAIAYVLGIVNRSRGWRLLNQLRARRWLKIGYFLTVYGVFALMYTLVSLPLGAFTSVTYYVAFAFPYVATGFWMIYTVIEYRALSNLGKALNITLRASQILVVLGMISAIPTVITQVAFTFVFLAASCLLSIAELGKHIQGEAKPVRIRPVGVTIVSYLTLFASLYGFTYSFTIGSLLLSGSWWTRSDLTLFFVPIFLSVLAIILGAGLLRGKKWAYFVSMPYWIGAITASSYGVWRAGTIWNVQFALNFFILIPLMPLLFSIVFLVYFQTRGVKSFFKKQQMHTERT